MAGYFQLLFWFCATLLWLPQLGAQSLSEDLADRLYGLNLYAGASTARIYQQHGFNRLWQEPQFAELMSAIEASAEHGLSPDDYHLAELSNPDLERNRRDILATDAYLALAGHLLGGKLNPISLEPNWTAKGRERDLIEHLTAALAGNDIAASLESLAPRQPRYQLLRKALAQYRAIGASGSWAQIATGEVLKSGMRSPRVMALRARLTATGDLAAVAEQDDLYDDSLVEAVKHFQRRANLEPDGLVGPATLRKLNLTPQDRVDQLRVNLERWRWLPEDLGARHIRVNIANYHLEIHEGVEITRVHDVVVGRPYRQTPVFSAMMTYLVLNPWWETPAKLARLDILPKFQKDASVVESLGYQVLDRDGQPVNSAQLEWGQYNAANFPFRLRQKPGINNALGQVKFMFPNPHNVYLHDTPSRDLFDKTRRDFSSGCIRVKNAVDLVEWVLNGNGDWNRERIDKVLESGRETIVTLKQRIPVHLLYWTVVADADSTGVRFIDDIYQRDDKVLAALNLPPRADHL